MLRRALALALAIAAALTACGGADAPEPRSAAPSPSPSPTAEAANGPTVPGERFPTRPQAEEGERRLEVARGGAVRAPADVAAEPGTAGVYVVATVRDPQRLDARAGVFCRGSQDGRSGYELTIDARGRARVDRVQDGRRTLLAGFAARIDAAVPPDEPLPLILACGTGTEPEGGVSLGFVVGAQQFTFVRDPKPLDPGARGNAGLVVNGERGDQAAFAAFQLYVAQ